SKVFQSLDSQSLLASAGPSHVGSASDATVGRDAKTRAADRVVPRPPLIAAHDRFYRTRSTHPASLATIATLPSPSKAMWRGRPPVSSVPTHASECAATIVIRPAVPRLADTTCRP